MEITTEGVYKKPKITGKKIKELYLEFSNYKSVEKFIYLTFRLVKEDLCGNRGRRYKKVIDFTKFKRNYKLLIKRDLL